MRQRKPYTQVLAGLNRIRIWVSCPRTITDLNSSPCNFILIGIRRFQLLYCEVFNSQQFNNKSGLS